MIIIYTSLQSYKVVNQLCISLLCMLYLLNYMYFYLNLMFICSMVGLHTLFISITMHFIVSIYFNLIFVIMYLLIIYYNNTIVYLNLCIHYTTVYSICRCWRCIQQCVYLFMNVHYFIQYNMCTFQVSINI